MLVGLALAIVLIDTGWHLAGRWLAPMPADALGFDDYVPSIITMPLTGLATITLGWFLAGLIGAFAALRIAQWRMAGWIVVAIVVTMNGWSSHQVDQPTWLTVAAIVAPLVGCWLAERHFHRARPGDPLLN